MIDPISSIEPVFSIVYKRSLVMIKKVCGMANKSNHGWFALGDTVIVWPIHENSDPSVGKVIETGDPATVDWGTKWPTAVSYSIQFSTWNKDRYTGFRLYRKEDLAKNKKLSKFKIGDIVEIIKSDGYHDLDNPKKQQSINGQIGIITEKLVDDMYVKIYLQEDMKYVWREVNEIRKA